MQNTHSSSLFTDSQQIKITAPNGGYVCADHQRVDHAP
jgi:hypothetical protein